MRMLITIVSVFLVTSLTFGQTSADTNKNIQVKEELRKLFVELNEAFQKRDRKALDRIYADEFIYIHASGFVDNKTAHINDALSVDVINPIPIPTFDELYVYGDVAVFRGAGRSNVVSSIYGTTIYAKRGGRWQIIQIQGTQLLPERKAVEVDTKILDSYVGKYTNDSKELLTITREGKSLVVALQRPNVPKRTLISTSDIQFFDKIGSEYNFRKGEDGKVTHFDFRLNNREARWKKIE